MSVFKSKEDDEDCEARKTENDKPLVLDEAAFLATGLKPEPPAASQVDATLAERGNRYGTFKDNSVIYDELIKVFQSSPNYASAPPEVRHALGNIATKLARLLTGDVMYFDNWRDIAGYATLMDKICQGEIR